MSVDIYHRYSETFPGICTSPTETQNFLNLHHFFFHFQGALFDFLLLLPISVKTLSHQLLLGHNLSILFALKVNHEFCAVMHRDMFVLFFMNWLLVSAGGRVLCAHGNGVCQKSLARCLCFQDNSAWQEYSCMKMMTAVINCLKMATFSSFSPTSDYFLILCSWCSCRKKELFIKKE